ncbi:DUF2637 domain-containing protein [Nocardiopsis sp. NPDC055551]
MDSSRRSRWTTIVAVLMLAVIAAVVSYSHMYELALRHGEPEWRAALFPLSVDGMIVASSMTLLSDARNGRKGGLLPWTLFIIGSGASLAANVAVADPTMWSRIIHAWPSFALIGAYELLMRAFRTAARSVRSADAARTHMGDERLLQDHTDAETATEESQGVGTCMWCRSRLGPQRTSIRLRQAPMIGFPPKSSSHLESLRKQINVQAIPVNARKCSALRS